MLALERETRAATWRPGPGVLGFLIDAAPRGENVLWTGPQAFGVDPVSADRHLRLRG